LVLLTGGSLTTYAQSPWERQPPPHPVVDQNLKLFDALDLQGFSNRTFKWWKDYKYVAYTARFQSSHGHPPYFEHGNALSQLPFFPG
jgi:hypothetical protein